MSKSRHSEEQMIGALEQLEAGRKAEDVAAGLAAQGFEPLGRMSSSVVTWKLNFQRFSWVHAYQTAMGDHTGTGAWT
jgi:hypothetical protein